MKSSNPALNNDQVFQQYYGQMLGTKPEKANVTTLQGVVNKTALLVAIALVGGAIGYSLLQTMPAVLPIAAITGFIICLGAFFLLAGKPQLSPVIAPIYAIVEGIFLGAFTALADRILEAQQLAVAGGVGLQAFIITMSAVVSMLVLYKTRIIRPTKTFQAVLYTLGGAVMLAYLVSFVMSLIPGVGALPLLSFASATQETGTMGLLGLGINVGILVLASLFLILDFKLVEDQVQAGAPKFMEWYCGFALLVTLAWIYFEAVKLVVRLAVIFGGRD
ncbi:MAG: Bax inhibitor-1/YccA family protein [Planctomycetota bacterium]|jgi:uncharacterized YccA/Bax inhibitor family protein